MMTKLSAYERAWILKNARVWFRFLGAEYLMNYLTLQQAEAPNDNEKVFACAYGNAFSGQCILTISPVWWHRFSLEQKREILVHEICHLVVMTVFFRPKDKTDHGPEWRKLMRKCGYTPRARYAWVFPEVDYQRAA